MLEVMHQRVQAIHRALTGTDVPDQHLNPDADAEGERVTETSDEALAERFAQLEVLARTLPQLAESVPPFSFTPPVDVITEDDQVVLELALPGVERADVVVEHQADALVIRGVRRDHHASSGRGRRFHAEIPRGPFFRVIPLPQPISGEPSIQLDRGVLRIALTLATRPAVDRGDPPSPPPPSPAAPDDVPNQG